ncbi:MAG: 30S ribosomal protein S6 [Clostridia bacterium]|jgi:small subunit ribosomal protein S6|nr:30S ribosomal protein S6 [Clostridia bacterium]
MNKYQLLTIFSASLNDEDKEKVVEKYTKLLESKKATITKVDKWGIKKLAYPINYKAEGYYVVFEFEADATVPAEITKNMNIDEAVMRHKCVRK